MPTILTHAALPLIAAWGIGPRYIPWRLAWAGVAIAVIPDLDVAGMISGVSPNSIWGHRGFSHSIIVAAVLAVVLTFTLAWRRRWSLTMVFLFLSGLSHGLTDMLTNGGRGIALLWPFDSERIFAPIRPVKVSPILFQSIEIGKLSSALISELIWLAAPALFIALFVRLLSASYIDLPKGQS